MPRVQDAIPSLDRRARKGHSNPLLLSTLRFAPESRGPGRTSRGKSMQDQIVKIFEQFDRTGSSIRQASARSDARPQAFPPSRNDDRRHRTHASDPEGLFKLGRLGAKGNTAPKIWN